MSEFRKDIVSGDWIVMAPERSSRPHGLKGKTRKRVPSPKAACPFEHPERTGNWPPVHRWPAKGDWKTILIPNKYPALRHDPLCAFERAEGIYKHMNGTGWHDLVVTRDHAQSFPDLPPPLAERVFAMIQARYADARRDKCLRYVSAFGNWGASAGASLFHPHYQILSLPIIPPHVQHALQGSARYFRAHGRCVHCDIIAYERKRKTGLIIENPRAIAFVPFASREPYSFQIFPKKHEPDFSGAAAPSIKAVSTLLQKTLARVRQRLADPDYNFFIHSAPLRGGKKFGHYHWHVEVAPKISVPAGFELSTGIDINTVPPEAAAKLLR